MYDPACRAGRKNLCMELAIVICSIGTSSRYTELHSHHLSSSACRMRFFVNTSNFKMKKNCLDYVCNYWMIIGPLLDF